MTTHISDIDKYPVQVQIAIRLRSEAGISGPTNRMYRPQLPRPLWIIGARPVSRVHLSTVLCAISPEAEDTIASPIKTDRDIADMWATGSNLGPSENDRAIQLINFLGVIGWRSRGC
jgi:hypothetical protein